jgi:AcrR family transcriptional regulator
MAARVTPNGKADTTAERLWVAAAQMFREQGYASATTRELAERLGITRATLYYHISKKEDLLHGICREALERVTAAVTEALDGVEDPLERLRALMTAHLVSMLTDVDMHATMLLELDALTGEYRREVVGLRDQYESLVSHTVFEGQRSGALRTDLTAKQLTLALLSLLNWPITWYRPGGELDPPEFAGILFELYVNGSAGAT